MKVGRKGDKLHRAAKEKAPGVCHASGTEDQGRENSHGTNGVLCFACWACMFAIGVLGLLHTLVHGRKGRKKFALQNGSVGSIPGVLTLYIFLRLVCCHVHHSGKAVSASHQKMRDFESTFVFLVYFTSEFKDELTAFAKNVQFGDTTLD